MSTKIEVGEETRAGLNRYASVMKQRLGRRVTFDEVITELLEREGVRQSQSPARERRRGWRKGKNANRP
ncbi:MAG: hypothetical protein ABSG45_02680 [Nitrososphaerales archaeon]